MAVDAEDKPVLAVTGLAVEARIAAGPGRHVVCSGSDPERLAALLVALDAKRYGAVISFGIAGALDPGLRAGDIVIAEKVIDGAGALPVSAKLTRALSDRLSKGGRTAKHGVIAGTGSPVIEAAAKAALRTATGAAAVDMESHVAARFAATVGLPVGVVRVISDPAERSLPPLARRALRPDGRIDSVAIAAELAREPGQIGRLIRTGLDAGAAFAALRRVRGLLELGRGFGGADLR